MNTMSCEECKDGDIECGRVIEVTETTGTDGVTSTEVVSENPLSSSNDDDEIEPLISKLAIGSSSLLSIVDQIKEVEITNIVTVYSLIFLWEILQMGGNWGCNFFLAAFAIVNFELLYYLHVVILGNQHGSVSALLSEISSQTDPLAFLVGFNAVAMAFPFTWIVIYIGIIIGFVTIVVLVSFRCILSFPIHRNGFYTFIHRGAVGAFVISSMILFLFSSVHHGSDVLSTLLFFLSVFCFQSFHKFRGIPEFKLNHKGKLLVYEALGFLSLNAAVVFTLRNVIEL